MSAPDGWLKIDRRTVYVSGLMTAGVAVVTGIPFLLGFADSGHNDVVLAIGIPVAVAAVLGVMVLDYVRWLKTRYRIGTDRVELHTGLLVVKRRSLARERIRTVDLTAGPLLRVFGLTNVKLGTGEQTSSGASTLLLNPVTREEGDRLRQELLRRELVDDGKQGRDGTLAKLDFGWIRYAPLSFVVPLLGFGAGGAVMQVANWAGVEKGVIRWVGDLFTGVALPLMILILAALLLVVGVVGSLGLWVEMWSNYHLEREPGGTLRVRRGLFTTRSISIEQARLRGVELVEPLGTRLAGAARLDAVTTGIAQNEEEQKTDTKTLLPAAPKEIADELAATVLRERTPPTDAAGLIGHPIAARGRRLRWAVGTVLVLAAVLVGIGLWLTSILTTLAWIALGLVIAGVPIAVPLALDAYRNLGHKISGEYLVARSGTVRRGTVALQRDGIIGWTVKQSIFQRRAGLVTLTATTAAGAGAYSVFDAAADEGVEFADEVVPGLLAPFVIRD